MSDFQTSKETDNLLSGPFTHDRVVSPKKEDPIGVSNEGDELSRGLMSKMEKKSSEPESQPPGKLKFKMQTQSKGEALLDGFNSLMVTIGKASAALSPQNAYLMQYFDGAERKMHNDQTMAATRDVTEMRNLMKANPGSYEGDVDDIDGIFEYVKNKYPKANFDEVFANIVDREELEGNLKVKRMKLTDQERSVVLEEMKDEIRSGTTTGYNSDYDGKLKSVAEASGFINKWLSKAVGEDRVITPVTGPDGKMYYSVNYGSTQFDDFMRDYNNIYNGASEQSMALGSILQGDPFKHAMAKENQKLKREEMAARKAVQEMKNRARYGDALGDVLNSIESLTFDAKTKTSLIQQVLDGFKVGVKLITPYGAMDQKQLTILGQTASAMEKIAMQGLTYSNKSGRETFVDKNGKVVYTIIKDGSLIDEETGTVVADPNMARTIKNISSNAEGLLEYSEVLRSQFRQILEDNANTANDEGGKSKSGKKDGESTFARKKREAEERAKREKK